MSIISCHIVSDYIMSHNVISYLIASHLSYYVVIYNITFIYSSYGVMYGDLEKKRNGKTRTTEKNRRG